jgi:ATP-dependent Lon protease
MELYGPGYHIFVSGLSGTRRASSIASLLKEIQGFCSPVSDKILVYNFEDPHCPLLVSLPRGKASAFVKDLQRIAQTVFLRLPKALNAPAMKKRLRAIQGEGKEEERALFSELQALSEKEGLVLVLTEGENGEEGGQDIFPRVEKEPVPPEALASLVAAGKLEKTKAEELLAAREKLLENLASAQKKAQEIYLKVQEQILSLWRKAGSGLISGQFSDMSERWGEGVSHYLQQLEAFLLEQIPSLLVFAEQNQVDPNSQDSLPPQLGFKVLRASQEEKDCPVLFEASPTWENLFGSILPGKDGSPARINQVQGGALLKADGGYLVLRLADVLTEHGVWNSLKRVLKTGLLEIRAPESPVMGVSSPLKPMPIPLRVKVVLIGNRGTYDVMSREDPEFPKIFKIHAQFEADMPRDEGALLRYSSFIASLVDEENLLPFSPEAAGRIAELGVRLSGNRDRISTRFGDVSDLLREASFLAQKNGNKRVDRESVLLAERARRRRHSLPEEKYLEMVTNGSYYMENEGFSVGEINGLVVLDYGVFVFGHPVRISAQVGVGAAGIVDIEREAELSGPIHLKGVQILVGWLTGTFAQDFPLSLSARICFEQSYGPVDGDSASAAELCALLSALSEVPLRQDFGMTGSVDQKGRIQAVGGVNEKIEGYFRTCRAKGMEGVQSVIIPASCVQNLQLAPEVLEAVEAGTFQVFSVSYIQEALEILTGKRAGSPTEPNSILGGAQSKLERFAEICRLFREP